MNEPAEKRETLEEYFDRTWDHAGFKPMPHYFKEGDYVSYFARDELCHAERLDDVVTVYVSDETNELMGCKIKGVSRLAKDVVHVFGITDGEIRLAALFLPGVYIAGTTQQKKRYYDLAKVTGDLVVDCREALTAT